MALVVFLRGVNVGGHRTYRPSILARELSDYDVVNVGAAGTFVVRKPGPRAKFRAALLKRLPFETEVMLCDGRDLLRLEMENPFETEHSRPDIVRFVSILSKAGVPASIPITLPPSGEWLVRVIASRGQFVFGGYRRHMKTIGYLCQGDKLLGARATTRNWNTINAIVRILKDKRKEGHSFAPTHSCRRTSAVRRRAGRPFAERPRERRDARRAHRPQEMDGADDPGLTCSLCAEGFVVVPRLRGNSAPEAEVRGCVGGVPHDDDGRQGDKAVCGGDGCGAAGFCPDSLSRALL